MRKRRGYFFVSLISAAIVFGCLTAFISPRYSGMQYGCSPHYGWHSGYYNRYNFYRNDAPPYAYPDSVNYNQQQPEKDHQ